MKTDRFDDEFRRKLLGLPADTDPGEVDRVQTYVKTHLPSIPGTFWGNMWLLGGAGLMLVASLTYNFIQSYRNTHLQASLDSLTKRGHLIEKIVTRDTIYVANRPADNQQKSISGELNTNTPPTSRESHESHLTATSRSTQKQGESEWIRTNEVKSLAANPASQSVKPAYPTESLAKPAMSSEEVNSVDRIAPVAGSYRATPNKSATNWRAYPKKRATDRIAAASTDESVQPVEPIVSKRTSSNSSNEVARRLSTRRSASPNRVSDYTPTVDVATSRRRGQGDTPEITYAGTVTTNRKTGVKPILEDNHQAIAFEPLPNRQLDTFSAFSKVIPGSRLLVLPNNQSTARKSSPRWHLTLPDLSVPNAHYRVGGGITIGDDQLGGALLGEVALNRHWSLQAGIRVLDSQGFHYRNDRDYTDHEHEDFRQKYASQVSTTSAIEDISKAATIIQVPIQLAYHYPLNQQWRLRFSIGTDLDLWVRSAIRYKHQENSRSSEELTRIQTPTRLINNLTLTPSVEWYRKKWLFRAGPFISPQLRSVSYKPDDFSWGANVQILYRLGK